LEDNYIDAEIERRKSKVGGYQKFKAFASRAGSKTASVAKRVGDGTTKAIKNFESSRDTMRAKSLKNTKSKLELERAKFQLAKTKNARKKIQGNSGGPLSGLGGDSPFSLNKPDVAAVKKKPKGERVVIYLNK
jgi:hypothetical protein